VKSPVGRNRPINIYVPKRAAKKIVNILNDSDIHWDNFIPDKLRDLRMHGMAVISYRILWETGKIIKIYYADGDGVNYLEVCNFLFEDVGVRGQEELKD
jgi:hypothetical protein